VRHPGVIESVDWIEGSNRICFVVVVDGLARIDTPIPRSAEKIVELIEQDDSAEMPSDQLQMQWHASIMIWPGVNPEGI